MTELLRILVEEFNADGMFQNFDGTKLLSLNVSLGETTDENGNHRYFMVNPHNKIVYEFKNEEQAVTIFQMISKGI